MEPGPPRSSRHRRLATISGIFIAGVVLVASLGLYSLERHEKAPVYPLITVEPGSNAMNFSWNTTPTQTSDLDFGFVNSSASVRSNGTGALSGLTIQVQGFGSSSVTSSADGVATLEYIFMVLVVGQIAPGLDPTSVAIEVTDIGTNTDPVMLVVALPQTPWSPLNVSLEYQSESLSFDGIGSLNVSTQPENLAPAHADDFFFDMPVQVQAQLTPIANHTVGLSSFQFRATLNGLGQSVPCSVEIGLRNSYS